MRRSWTPEILEKRQTLRHLYSSMGRTSPSVWCCGWHQLSFSSESTLNLSAAKGSSIIRSFLSWEEEQGYLHLCCRSDTGPPAQWIWGQQWQRVVEGETSGPSWFPNTSQLLTPPRVMTLAACESSSYLVSATHFPVIPKNYCQYDTGHMSRKHKQWNKGQHLVKEN